MSISPETWAIVAATGLGPVVAVLITSWREEVRAKVSRRLHVFRTLMATRKMGISGDHVNAINLVEVDFYGCKSVETAWSDYKSHLNDNSKPEDEPWREKKEDLLARLLSEMAGILGFRIPAIDIFKGGYAPSGSVQRDQMYVGALNYINQLSEGKSQIPLWVNGVTPPVQSGSGAVPTAVDQARRG